MLYTYRKTDMYKLKISKTMSQLSTFQDFEI